MVNSFAVVMVVVAFECDVGFDVFDVNCWGVLCVLWEMVVAASVMVGDMLVWLGLFLLCGSCLGLMVCLRGVVLG